MLKPINYLLANVFASDFARGIVRVALGWVVLEQHGASGLSFFILITSLGQFLGSMLAGHVTDRNDKRKVASIVTSISAVAILGLAGISNESGHSLTLVCSLSAAVHFALSIQDNATRTLIPSTVGTQSIENANAKFITVGEVGYFVAPLLAGYWTTYFGPSGVLAIAAFVAIVGALAISAIPTSHEDRRNHAQPVTHEYPTKLNILKYRWLYLGAALAMIANVLLVPISYVLVPIVIESNGLSAVELGYFYAAMSLGLATVGALNAEKFGASLGAWQMPVFVCFAALTYIGTLFFQYVVIIIICGAFAGFFLAKFEVSWNAIIQRESPPSLLGRIYAFGSWTSFAARSLGVFWVGILIANMTPTMVVTMLIAMAVTIIPIIAIVQNVLLNEPNGD
ncbi:MAG: MFS transporter [Aliishimia sp.]